MSEARCNASLDGHRCEFEPGHDGKHQMVDDGFMVRWAAEPSPEVAPMQMKDKIGDTLGGYTHVSWAKPAVAPRETQTESPIRWIETPEGNLKPTLRPAAAPTPVEPKWVPIMSDLLDALKRSRNLLLNRGIAFATADHAIVNAERLMPIEDGSLAHPYHAHESAAPAESQGVERAQPVEPYRAKETIWVADSRYPGYESRINSEGHLQTRRVADSEPDPDESYFRRHKMEEFAEPPTAPAPVEGVERVTEVAPGEYERVTDDAPARVEPTCATCGDSGKIQIREGESGPFIGEAPCPAKHTDDRPAETIPERWQSVLEDINRTPTHLQNIQQTHRRVLIEELGRAETRIEVLEAALRKIEEYAADHIKYVDQRSVSLTVAVHVKGIALAALAAPSGVKV